MTLCAAVKQAPLGRRWLCAVMGQMVSNLWLKGRDSQARLFTPGHGAMRQTPLGWQWLCGAVEQMVNS